MIIENKIEKIKRQMKIKIFNLVRWKIYSFVIVKFIY